MCSISLAWAANRFETSAVKCKYFNCHSVWQLDDRAEILHHSCRLAREDWETCCERRPCVWFSLHHFTEMPSVRCYESFNLLSLEVWVWHHWVCQPAGDAGSTVVQPFPPPAKPITSVLHSLVCPRCYPHLYFHFRIMSLSWVTKVLFFFFFLILADGVFLILAWHL